MVDSTPQPPDLLGLRQRRRNVRALVQYGVLIVAVVVVNTMLFHAIAWRFEERQYSLVTGLYWTLSTMTTLGLGDIVFQSDVGRLFTALVLLSGILLFFVVLPFAFIRFFYEPWIETRRAPDRLSGHVIITRYDNIAPALIEKLELHGVPYFVTEPNPTRANTLSGEGIRVVAGAIDDRATFDRLRASAASLVVANDEDTTNANIILTVRESAPRVSIAAIADRQASIDILESAGASHVFPLKHQLGEQLANRLNAGHAQTHIIGKFRDQVIAEFPLHNTPFVGRTIRTLGLRDGIGVNVLGIVEHAKFQRPDPDVELTASAVLVVLGSRGQITELDELLAIYDVNVSPAVVIGGGKVGRSVTSMLKRKRVPVHLIERDAGLQGQIGSLPDRLFIGDAAELAVLEAAGVRETPSVVITTNDDATNIYLTVYCRRLAPESRIVARITNERNANAVRRAGADVALSHISLGVGATFALLRGHGLIVLGEGIELHELAVPESLVAHTIGESRIASRTGVNIIALQDATGSIHSPEAASVLLAETTMVTIGDQAQLEAFARTFP